MELSRPSHRTLIGGRPVPRSFFGSDPVFCARGLIGCTLGLGATTGIIVETEAYAAKDDPACHTWSRPSARDFIAGHPPGTAYVYLNYGMHWLLNFVVKGEQGEGFVLIRALEPVAGMGVMQRRRNKTALPDLCNGPAKLTQALGINVTHHGSDPFDSTRWTLSLPQKSPEIAVSTRIGISRAKEYPWRFLLSGNPCVSVKP